MKALNSVGKLFIVALAVVIVLWLLLRDIQCNSPSVGKEGKDRVVKALDSAEKIWLLKEDSLKRLASAGSIKLDSLRRQKTEADKDLKVYIDRSSALAREIIRMRRGGGPVEDNSVMIEKCDSLANAVEGLNYKIGYYKWVVDSMTNQQDVLVNIERARVEEAIEFNRIMRQGFDSVSNLYDHLDGLYKKAKKKLDKKYTLSLSVGYGVGTRAEPQPFVGVTFGRTLIRF
jgi:competence protein ComGC